MLLVGATLLIQSFRRLSQVDLGLNPAGLLSLADHAAGGEVPGPGAPAGVLRRRCWSGCGRSPACESAALADYLPVQGSAKAPFGVEGRPPVAQNDQPLAWLMEVSPGFFRTLQARLVKGQEFDRQRPPRTRPPPR